jgi:hypothetical protein
VPVSALVLPGLALGEFGIRPQLTVGNVNDPAEVETDRVADGVVAALHGSAGASLPAARSGRHRRGGAGIGAAGCGAP